MRGSIRGITTHERESLQSGWEFCSTAPDRFASPAEISADSLLWRRTIVPNTAAGSLRDLGEWNLASPARRFDAEDWWYRCEFPAPQDLDTDEQLVLQLDGLATVADVWLNGQHRLASDNMFRAYELPLNELAARNQLVIRFRSLDQLLTTKRPRGRWRAPMIENQQLRWFRTTLLGRTPGWSPPAAAVGPWREVWIERRKCVDVRALSIRTLIREDSGVVELEAALVPLGAHRIESSRLILEREGESFATDVAIDRSTDRCSATLAIANAERWWPHTHGTPATYSARLEVVVNRAGVRTTCTIDLAPLGFRTIDLDSADGNFTLTVNDERIFCRGACWTPLDVVTLRATQSDYTQIIDEIRASGMNMLRIGGTMVYEDSAFFELCDANGILVWQDLMFANMDYPDADTAFVASVQEELEQHLNRIVPHASLAVICGNSEVEQQAAMWGAPRERWKPSLFHEIVPAKLTELRVNVPYWPSSAHGGAFPHQVDSGTTSYYGVGAYLRSLDDARRSELKFATECLGFANIPEDETLQSMPNGLALRVHHPDWKLRAPRDLGAGWDFDDVRDFYLRTLFGVDPVQLRYADHERYLYLSRIVSGETMAAAFSEWRRKRSTCAGALVWFLRDLWAGAGWGLIDANGDKKAAHYILRRVLQPVGLSMSDEGNNGLYLHAVNEMPTALDALLTLSLYRSGEILVAQGKRTIRVEARDALEIRAAELLDGFHDMSYAYRFGPLSYDVAVATLHGSDEKLLMHSHYFPAGLAARETHDVGLKAHATRTQDQTIHLELVARAFARWVTVRADGYRCSDQYFHLLPGVARSVTLTARTAAAPRIFRGHVTALNASAPTSIELSA